MKNIRTAVVVTCLLAVVAPALGQGPVPVNVRFSWKLKGEYAQLYVAEANGHFKNAGLAVRLGEGAGAQPALAALLQGQEDLVLLPGVFALSAISRGMPVKLVALYHPVTPMGFISHPDNPVRTPKDLEGKTVPTSVGETATTYLDVLCAKNGVDCGKIKRVQMESGARLSQFLAGRVDLVSVYQTNDLPLVEQQTGKKFPLLDLVQYGVTVPGMALVSTDAVIAKKADALRKFLRATAQGIQDARRSPEEAARIMIRSWPAAPPLPVVTAQVKATLDAIPAPAGRPVGWIDEATIRQALELLKTAKEIETARPAGEYFTNTLLDGA